MVWGGGDQLFCQLHFATVIALESAVYQQVAGQLHLTDHPDLRKAAIPMLVGRAAITRSVFSCVRRVPDDAVNSQ
ncbi:hypothetical protein D3C79_898580 [compost metagenome]